MRFVLDEDVDARIRVDITSRGHDCWTIPDAGLAGEKDPDVAVYAARVNAILITNDREFGSRLRKQVSGRQVLLNCKDFRARTVLLKYLDELMLILARHDDLFASVSTERVEYVYGNESWD